MLSQAIPDTFSNSANFLSLPRELRDIIYSYLVYESRPPPEDPEHAGDREFQSKIYFEARSHKPALLQLKLCNWQLHDEVHDALDKHAISDHGPALDIMVRGSSIWPTWIALPTTPHLDPTVNVSLRLFEAKGWGGEFSTGAYRGLWSLFNLLVSQGPCLIHNRYGGLQHPLRISRLSFEITLCFPTSVDDLFGTYRDVFDRLERLAFDNVGLGNVETIEACMGVDRRVWRLLPTGSTLPGRME